MNIKTADRSLAHLFPVFREKLARVLKETEQALGEPWALVEGFRSQERQTWLYSAGRTREGPTVTWLRSPLYHGAGLAADCMPKRHGYKAPRLWWETYLRIGKAHGLDNPAFVKGDMGHLQLSDPAVRARALVWVRNGFQDPQPPAQSPADHISVLVDGQPTPDADAFLLEGKAWVKLRPIADGLDWVVAEVTGSGERRMARLVDDAMDESVPVTLKGGSAYVRAKSLPAEVLWVGGEKLLTITRKEP